MLLEHRNSAVNSQPFVVNSGWHSFLEPKHQLWIIRATSHSVLYLQKKKHPKKRYLWIVVPVNASPWNNNADNIINLVVCLLWLYKLQLSLFPKHFHTLILQLIHPKWKCISLYLIVQLRCGIKMLKSGWSSLINRFLKFYSRLRFLKKTSISCVCKCSVHVTNLKVHHDIKSPKLSRLTSVLVNNGEYLVRLYFSNFILLVETLLPLLIGRVQHE